MLSASGADLLSAWVNLTKCQVVNITLRISVSAATLQAALRFRGTANPNQDAVEPLLANVAALTALPTGVTGPTAGVVTLNNPGVGVSSATFYLPSGQIPKFLQLEYDFTSGGGTVAVQAFLAAWG
jgi:hypothetical protein